MELELVAFDGAVQVGVDLQRGDGPVVGGFVEDLDAGPALLLGPVHRGVGVAEEVVRGDVGTA